MRRTTSCLVILLLLAFVTGAAQAPPNLWEAQTNGKVSLFLLTAFGTLLVGTERETVALDPATGDVIWRSTDLRNCKVKIDKIVGIEFESTECRFGSRDKVDFVVGAEWPSALLSSGGWEAALNLSSGRLVIDTGAQPGWLRFVRVYGRAGRLVAVGGSGSESALRVFDLYSGHLLSESLVPEIDSFDRLGEADVSPILFAARKISDKGHLVGAIDLATGQLLWTSELPVGDPNGLRAVRIPPDRFVVLQTAVDEPNRAYGFSLSSGELLWQSKDFGYVHSHDQRDGTLVLATLKEFLAIDVGDGSLRWRASSTGNEQRVALTSYGVLVGCGAGSCADTRQVRLLNTDTGHELGRIQLADRLLQAMPIDDRLVLLTRSQLYSAHLPKMVASELATFRFRGDEGPSRLDLTANGYLVSSGDELALISRSGTVVYQKRYRAPGRSFLSRFATQLAEAGLNAANQLAAQQFAATQATQNAQLDRMAGGQGVGFGLASYTKIDLRLAERIAALGATSLYSFFHTQDPDLSGRRGFSLVKVANTDGREVGRVWLEDRNPEMLLDPISSRVFLKRRADLIVGRVLGEAP